VRRVRRSPKTPPPPPKTPPPAPERPNDS
jgi:hypothetical protein